MGGGTEAQLPAQPGTHLQGEPAWLLMLLAGQQHQGTVARIAPCLGLNVSLPRSVMEGQLPWLSLSMSLFRVPDKAPAPGASPGRDWAVWWGEQSWPFPDPSLSSAGGEGSLVCCAAVSWELGQGLGCQLLAWPLLTAALDLGTLSPNSRHGDTAQLTDSSLVTGQLCFPVTASGLWLMLVSSLRSAPK